MKIGQRIIANFESPYIIAELGANHNGQMELARQMIDQAVECGCHCVKFQSWTKDSIFAKQVYEENYFLTDDYRNREDYTLESIIEEYSFSEAELMGMRNYCLKVGVDFASTPFSEKEVDFLVEHLKVSFIKVASMDLNNYPFLDYIARKNLPVMLSTGLSTLSEIDQAIRVIESAGNGQIILLHCVSVYPPDDREVNLNNMDMLRLNYPEYPVGFSDHTIGFEIPLAAVAKGACVIEKHYTLDKNMDGWDHKVSATMEEMKIIVNGSQRVNHALGTYRREVSKEEQMKKPAFRRSFVAARFIPAGAIIKREDLTLKRPGTGIEPQYLNFVLGRTTKHDIEYDKVIQMEDLV
ncbi:MAG: N-acetylneuraminate synthase family protein [Candidatus Methanofastidiosum sp.]|nr:N-acetylneuraminate synthase family protein [Methanofastidiosum sp.]